jgi:hypothetical protein
MGEAVAMYALIPASLHDLTGLEPFQSEQWARVKQYLGWKGYAFFITDEKGKELAIFLCLVRQLFPGFSLAYIPLGPLSLQGVRLPECMESDASWLESISRQLHTYIGTAVFQIQWDLPWHTQSADIQSTARIHVCKESTQPTGTWVVDLRSGLEEVRKDIGNGLADTWQKTKVLLRSGLGREMNRNCSSGMIFIARQHGMTDLPIGAMDISKLYWKNAKAVMPRHLLIACCCLLMWMKKWKGES